MRKEFFTRRGPVSAEDLASVLDGISSRGGSVTFIQRRVRGWRDTGKLSSAWIYEPGDPVREVEVGFWILQALGLRRRGAEVISCPTCGRTRVDLIPLAEEVERRLAGLKAPLTVAVMGCEVNGPGEAREADVGVACGKGVGLLFRKGEIVRKVPEAEIADALMEEVRALAEKTSGGG